jgi:superfamily II DNA or RNA helicase
VNIPNAKYDRMRNCLRSEGIHYSQIIQFLNLKKIAYEDKVMDLIPFQYPLQTASSLNLRTYQKEALKNWSLEHRRGCVILPTGAGKTIIGLKAMEIVCSSSLVIVPTLDLIYQWETAISRYFDGIKVGQISAGKEDLQAITISTYDSAYIKASRLGNRFSLIIFDEVHHLGAPSYRSIAESFVAPYRLGLTATIEREDRMDQEFPQLVGKIVYVENANSLAKGKHLAEYEIERRQVNMSPEEETEYIKNTKIYRMCLKKIGINMNAPNAFRRLIMISSKSSLARRAVLARNKASKIALNSSTKIDELRQILSENRGIKTIIFTQHNSMVYKISNEFLIPFITHKSNKEERQDILNGFRSGRFKALVTSKVLDEGVDVPDAELGIIVSGSGSKREFIQRLGRLLRPKSDSRKGRLIEIISSRTQEVMSSRKRRETLSGLNMQKS